MANSAYREFNFGLGEAIDTVREQVAVSPKSASRRAPTRSTAATCSPATYGGKSANSAFLDDGERGYGGAGWVPRAHGGHGGNLARLGRGGLELRRAFESVRGTRSRSTRSERRSASTCRSCLSGEHVGALAMSEPGAGSDVVSMQLQAAQPAIGMCSTAARCGSPTAPRPSTGGLRQDQRRRPARAASAPSSSRRISRDLRPRRSSTSSACAARAPASWYSMPARFPPKTAWRGKSGRQRADEGARLRTGGAVRRTARHHGRGPRRGRSLRARAQAIRSGDRHFRTGAGQAGRHVRLAQCLPQLCLHGRRGLRSRRSYPQGCRRLHPVLRRGRHPRRARCDSASGRQWLHQRLPHGKVAARCEALRNRRRHLRDPPHADRPRAVWRRDD